MDDIRLQLNDLTQMELDQLFYALLNAFCGVRHELRSNTEHTWGSLLIVQQGLEDFSLEVVREAAHVMLLVGFLKSLDDRGDTFGGSGLTQLGGVRLRYYKSATYSQWLGLALAMLAMVIIVAMQYTFRYSPYISAMLFPLVMATHRYYYP